MDSQTRLNSHIKILGNLDTRFIIFDEKSRTKKFKFPIREYRQSDQQKLKSQLEILTKTFRKLTINFSPGQVTTVVNKIERLKSAQTVKDLPAFQLGSEPTEEEWDFFSLKKEYEYMGVPNNEWKLTVTI